MNRKQYREEMRRYRLKDSDSLEHIFAILGIIAGLAGWCGRQSVNYNERHLRNDTHPLP